ncbi:MAG: twin-arginine translocation signal domain-containing protein, partial [Pirellulaceae bacterium]
FDSPMFTVMSFVTLFPSDHRLTVCQDWQPEKEPCAMTLSRRHFLQASITAAAAASSGSLVGRPRRTKPAPIYQMGSRRDLFVDDLLVAQTRGKVEFELHHPIPREQVIQHAQPWE